MGAQRLGDAERHRRDRRMMKHHLRGCDGLRHRVRVAHVTPDQIDPPTRPGQVFFPSGREVVENRHRPARVDERLHQVAPDKTRTTRDQRPASASRSPHPRSLSQPAKRRMPSSIETRGA